MLQPYDMPLEQLQNYTPPLSAPPDLDAFWEATLQESGRTPLDANLELVDYPAEGVHVFRITLRGYGEAPLSGWYVRPTQDGPHPGLVLYHGYNWNYEGHIHDVVNWGLHGYAVLAMAVRGQQGSGESMPSPHGHVAGWMTAGILDPEHYYYRGVYADAVRALSWLHGRPEVDAARIGVTGGSQGGGMTLAAAALSNIPVVAVAEYPFLCHFTRAVDIAPAGPYGEITEYLRQNGDPDIERQVFQTLSYFDVMNLASRVVVPTLVSVGLIDQLTPPSTIFAAFHHLGSETKALRVYRYFGHEFIPRFHMEKLQWLKQYLKHASK
ncbi:acetylxylan esterase [Sulfobacillus harzensis]|uniref:Acetylxylan esterase n=1 Tax=Sulfobacillus harzensis TaxID=2729629 RepID=A0A7Y0L610_9FIRM|nr:acetylxylan esterase [Sulfobacillus harzensis]NMP23871.1 acetylxylan esterase [Sulfobacillus harzensis]